MGRKRLTRILLIPLLALAFAAEAGGRWGVRLELPFKTVAYAEQVAFSTAWNEDEGPWDLSGLEILVGTEAVIQEETAVTPYFGLALYWPTFWTRVEVTSPFRFDRQTFGFAASLSVGGSWD